jgi:hypothetical protein
VAALLAVVLLTDLIHARIPPTTKVDRGEAFVPDPAIAKTLALGFDSVVSDYYWLQAIQAIGGETVISAEIGTHLGKLIDVVTTLNPHVDHPYRFAAVWMTESEENVRKANQLLERGIEYHPNEWRNHFYLGFNYFFYLMENEKAADALHEASQLPGAARYLPRLVARLRSHTADIDVAEVFLRDMLRQTEDESGRAGYQAALDEIEVEKKARFLDRAREAFEKLNGRDIMHVDELTSGPHPVLAAFPNPEPESLPESLSRGSEWKLDFETDQIVSTYYDARYALHFASSEHERAKTWKAERERSAHESEARAALEGSADAAGEENGGKPGGI